MSSAGARWHQRSCYARAPMGSPPLSSTFVSHASTSVTPHPPRHPEEGGGVVSRVCYRNNGPTRTGLLREYPQYRSLAPAPHCVFSAFRIADHIRTEPPQGATISLLFERRVSPSPLGGPGVPPGSFGHGPSPKNFDFFFEHLDPYFWSQGDGSPEPWVGGSRPNPPPGLNRKPVYRAR